MTLVKIRLDSGIEYDAAPEVSVALAGLTSRANTEKTRADAAEAARDKLQAQVDGHAAAVATAVTQARADAACRLKLETDATALGVKFAQDAKDGDIRAAVIKHVHGESIDLAGKSDAYVEARFDMALADGLKAKALAGTNRKAVTGEQRGDAKDEKPRSAAQARADMQDRIINQKAEA